VADDGRFTYEDTVTWTEGRRGRVAAGGLDPITVSPPPEFDGEEGLWNPEQLLLASANSCLLVTFVAIALKMRVPWASYRSRATAELSRGPDGRFAITRIDYYPEIEVPTPDDVPRASKAIERAEASCLISNSLKYPCHMHAAVRARGP
jgi:organic hydroperoxide reductase OsmC/OhrA